MALLTLGIEWFVQRHYLESISDDGGLDPQFKSLLKHHWLEEAQHTKIDTLMVHELAATLTAEEIEKAIDEYLEIGSSEQVCARSSRRSRPRSADLPWRGAGGPPSAHTGIVAVCTPSRAASASVSAT